MLPPGDRGGRVGVRQDVVGRVAGGAVRRDDQALLAAGPRRGCSRSSSRGCWSWWIVRSRWTGVPSRWHLPQVNGTCSGATGERGSSAGRMSWVPWQAVQRGRQRVAAGEGLAVERAPRAGSPPCRGRRRSRPREAAPRAAAPCLRGRRGSRCTAAPPWIGAAKRLLVDVERDRTALALVVKALSPWQARQSAFCWRRAAAGAISATSEARMPQGFQRATPARRHGRVPAHRRSNDRHAENTGPEG